MACSSDRYAKLRLALAFVVGLALIPITARWLAEIEWVRYSDNATTQSLFPHGVAVVVFLVALSAGVRQVWPALAFRPREILLCYVMVAIGSHLAGHDMIQILLSAIAYVVRQATPDNNWATLIHPYLRPWTIPADGPGLKAFFEGGSSIAAPGVAEAWRVPLTAWAGFTLTLCAVMLGLSNLLRRQWEDERLTYPIAQVPLGLTRDNGRVLLDRLFLAGIAIGILPALMNTIKHFHPIWPGLRVQVHYMPPLEGVYGYAGAFPVCWHPFAFGLAYLIPTDLAFSCWFFYLFVSWMRVLAAALGFREYNGFPYLGQQCTGSHIGLTLIVLYNARRHIGRVWRGLWRGSDPGEDEALPYRLSMALVVAGSLVLLWWLHAVGLRWATAVVYLALFLTFATAVSRLRAEYGLPTNELFRRGADWVLLTTLGTRSFSRQELVGIGLMNWLGRTHRQLPMQVQSDMLEVARRSGLRMPTAGWAILAATVVGILAANWALLDVSLRTGIATAKVAGPANWAFGPEPWNDLGSWINDPKAPDLRQGAGFAAGALFCILLQKARTKWVWWPFHPGGFVVSASYGLPRLWVPLFFTSTAKGLLLRYGGHHAYLRLKPLFLGLIVGEYCSAIVRTLIDLGWRIYFPAESGIGGL